MEILGEFLPISLILLTSYQFILNATGTRPMDPMDLFVVGVQWHKTCSGVNG